MTAFWRPGFRDIERGVFNNIHQMPLSELWCRCELCKWSGPSEHFFSLTQPKTLREIHICDSPSCGGDENWAQRLVEQGWR